MRIILTGIVIFRGIGAKSTLESVSIRATRQRVILIAGFKMVLALATLKRVVLS